MATTYDYTVAMSTPRSVRFDEATVDRLADYASRHPGMSSSSAAALLVEEGLRMDAHPGVVFRHGAMGRRAGLMGGPDVWEIVRAIKSARGDLQVVEGNTGLPSAQLRIAVAYYGSYPDEIDREIREADSAEEKVAQAQATSARLLAE